MKQMKWLTAALLLVAASAQAAVITSAPSVEFMVVDGKKVKTDSWQPQQSIELTKGKHQIVMRFDDEVRRGSKEVIYTSRPYIFELQVDERNATLSLDKRIKNENEAQHYFTQGARWQVEYADGETAAIIATELKGDGFAAYADMEALVAKYNRANGIVFEQGESKDLNELLVEVNDNGKVSIKGDTLTQLKLWYSKATNQERKAFRRWMIDQE